MWENLCYVFLVGSQEYLMSKQRRVSKNFRKFQKSEEIEEVFVMFNSNEVLNQYITMKKLIKRPLVSKVKIREST